MVTCLRTSSSRTRAAYALDRCCSSATKGVGHIKKRPHVLRPFLSEFHLFAGQAVALSPAVSTAGASTAVLRGRPRRRGAGAAASSASAAAPLTPSAAAGASALLAASAEAASSLRGRPRRRRTSTLRKAGVWGSSPASAPSSASALPRLSDRRPVTGAA